MVNEFGRTMYVVAKDVKLQIEFNPAKVQSYRLVGYETRILDNEDFNDDTKDAGEMGAGHTVTALYEIIPTGISGNIPRSIDPLKYQTETNINTQTGNSSELLTVKLRYKTPEEEKSKKIEKNVTDTDKDNVSPDFRFASAVAMFAQLLRNSDYKGEATYDQVIETAQRGLSFDPEGYRAEFVRLVQSAKGLKK